MAIREKKKLKGKHNDKERKKMDKKNDKLEKKKVLKEGKPKLTQDAEIYDDYYINLIEGRNPVLEALKSGREIDKLFVQRGQLEGSIKQIIAIARDKPNKRS